MVNNGGDSPTIVGQIIYIYIYIIQWEIVISQQLWDYISILYLFTIIGLHMYMHITTD